MIPYGRQNISEADIQAVVNVLRSDFLTQGPCVPRFEESIASKCDASFGVAVNSGTSALHIACLALGLRPNDRLWTSPNTFVASAACGLYCGSSVDFVDIDPNTYNMSVEALAKKLEQAKRSNELPKIVIPVHFAGQSCEMKAIHELSKIYNFKIIEDASHAIGARYADTRVGSCKYCDIAVFSFHPVKIITTGEGGVAVTNNADLASRMLRLRSHGITRKSSEMTKPSEGDWYYQQLELGFNYRMTDIQAALGSSQLLGLEQSISRRHEIARTYDEELDALPIEKPYQLPENYSSYHLYPIQLVNEETRKRTFRVLRAAGINVNVHYIPVHTHPSFSYLGYVEGSFPNAEQYYSRAISLPVFSSLSEVEQDLVIDTLSEALS